jgi:N-acetylmuramoyl-L-alanine amidase
MPAKRLTVATVLLLASWAGVAGGGLPTVTHEGRPYVELKRVAASLRPCTLDATAQATRARLKTGSHVVTFTRNWSQILVNGTPVVLDAPVRVRQGVWLVPESFVGRVLPKLAAGPPVVTAQAARLAASAPEGTLEELRVRSYPSFTRVVLETSGPVRHRVEQSGPKEARIRVLGIGADAQTEEVKDGFVDEIRVERAGADTLLRIVYEGTAGTIRVSTLADPPRLVLDVQRPVESGPSDNRVEVTPLRTIVLDAGHGGHDSGAVGPTGLMEKALALDVTKRVAKLVEERLGLKVLLTRDADVFVPLHDRTSFANRQRADLFVSIHANAHRVSGMDGVETYFLSSEATDNGARQVAALENGAGEKSSGRSTDKMDIVKTILWDLAQSEFQIESERLAEIVQDSVTQTLRIGSRGVKQAGFYVLGGAAMPAILLEIGFVTNPREERKLKESRYRDELARAIFAGIVEYKRHWDQRLRATGDPAPAPRTR